MLLPRVLPVRTTIALCLLFISLSTSISLAQPQPGDVYREYRWRPTADGSGISNSRWQRVTGPDSTDVRAHDFLPNLVNQLSVTDLEHAVRAEMSLEVLNVHPGTKGHRVRLNGGNWLPIPFSPLVPGSHGSGQPALEYYTMQYPVVPIPLNSLRNGANTFEFTASRGTSFANRWPQWISYGASIRVYYDKDAKDHPTGEITSHSDGATIGENEVFSATTSSTNPIRQVEFVGKYTDFNWKGDGNYRQWQDQTLYSQVRNHIGTDTSAPYSTSWDNDWVPDQDEPMEVSARIVDNTGLTYITPSVSGLELNRPYSVEMYKPFNVPRKWGTRDGKTHSARIPVYDDLSEAREAQITLATWNGPVADEIALNSHFLSTNVGGTSGHDLSYDSLQVPIDFIKPGSNFFSTYSDTIHHGIDVQWPGPVMFIKYQAVPEPSAFALFSVCALGLLDRRGYARSRRRQESACS